MKAVLNALKPTPVSALMLLFLFLLQWAFFSPYTTTYHLSEDGYSPTVYSTAYGIGTPVTITVVDGTSHHEIVWASLLLNPLLCYLLSILLATFLVKVTRVHPAAQVYGVVAAMVVLAFCMSIGLSKSHWGYFFSRPPVLDEIHQIASVKSVIPVETTADSAGNRTVVVNEKFSLAERLAHGRDDPYYCLDQRLLLALDDRGMLPTNHATSLSDLPDLFPLIGKTGILVAAEEGYDESDLLWGTVVDTQDKAGERMVFLALRGGQISNDHYPFYEMLFTAPDDAADLTYVRGQHFFYDVAGIEGLEWYVAWPYISLAAVALGLFGLIAGWTIWWLVRRLKHPDQMEVVNAVVLPLLLYAVATTGLSFAAEPGSSAPIKSPHPWLPPFGLDRVGSLPDGAEDSLAFEADALAQPDAVINPVDLGAILVPHDWLLLHGDQGGTVDVAALSRDADLPDARVAVWYASAPGETTAATIELRQSQRVTAQVPLPPSSTDHENDTLHVTIADGQGAERWRKSIPVMRVHAPPRWPDFGATETRLRYDGPISLRAEDGTLSEMDYDQGWNPELQDVVVSLPNGARYVFWRGSSYIPFWAGRYNTGLCFEWAETRPPPDGFVDSVEPLMDKELRYGRVQIIESTSARVHVRWTYQSCDFNYKVWGDSATEDYYFYPDAFGTRHLTLQSAPDGDYELSEVIILTPQAAYPFDVLPSNLADVLFLNGAKLEIKTPVLAEQQEKIQQSPEVPAIYRIRLNKREQLNGVYFNPHDTHLPSVFFAPFYDQGQMVTPAYWGSHWPLARGKSTGGQIDDRIAITPAHNSLMSWAFRRPPPLSSEVVETEDTLGQRRPMKIEQWAWLMGMSDATDEELLAWARSYAAPPRLEVTGGSFEGHAPERRASRVVVAEGAVSIVFEGTAPWVNPVLELAGAPGALQEVWENGERVPAEDYRWDGKVLWVGQTLGKAGTLRVVFEG